MINIFQRMNKVLQVKCSDNLVYRISPVYGLIEPGKSVKVDVLRYRAKNRSINKME